MPTMTHAPADNVSASPRLDLTREERLLLACARIAMTPEHQAQVRALLRAGGLDWEEVRAKAEWHKLLGLLYVHLRRIDAESSLVPAEVMASLSAAYRATAVRGLYLRSEVRPALDALSAKGIKTIVLKGAALAELLYRDPGLRPMSDVDLLVPQRDADRAQLTIADLGYRPTVDLQTQREMRATGRQMAALVGVKSRVAFEVHAHVVEVDNPLRFDISRVWDRAQAAAIAGTGALVMGPEDMLVHLSINFFKDRSFTSAMAIGQLVDIAETLRRLPEAFDWPSFVGEVREMRLVGPVHCALSLARLLLDAPVPEAVLAEIRPPRVTEKETGLFARRRVLDTERWVASALVAPSKRYGLLGAALSALRRVFPPRRYMAEKHRVPVGSPQVYWLYVRRFGEAIALLGRAVRHPRETRDDLAIDRWLHDLYSTQPQVQPEQHSLSPATPSVITRPSGGSGS